MYPTDLRYTKNHQWVRDDSGGTYTIGLTDFAQRRLGEIGDIELPQEGKPFEAADAFCSIQAVKDVSELYLPAAGTIAEVNFVLGADPELPQQRLLRRGLAGQPSHHQRFTAGRSHDGRGIRGVPANGQVTPGGRRRPRHPPESACEQRRRARLNLEASPVRVA